MEGPKKQKPATGLIENSMPALGSSSPILVAKELGRQQILFMVGSGLKATNWFCV